MLKRFLSLLWPKPIMLPPARVAMPWDGGQAPPIDFYAYAPQIEPEEDIYWAITQRLLFETGDRRRKLVRLLRNGYGFGLMPA